MKTGQFWSYTDYGVVTDSLVVKNSENYFAVKSDITGEEFIIAHGLKHLCSYHDVVTDSKKVGKTVLAELFLRNTRTIMTVNFNKQLDIDSAKKAIKELYANKGGNLLSQSDYEQEVDKIVPQVLSGEERTMIGRHYANVNDLGYVQFIDMEIPKDSDKDYDNRIRLVDSKRINWLIVNDTKYIRK